MRGEQVKRLPDRSSFGRVVRLMRKELRETLRDRRTVITLVLMPLLVYPLLSITFHKSLLMTSDQMGQASLVIGVETNRDGAVLRHLLLQGEQVLNAAEDVGGDERGGGTTGRGDESSRMEVKDTLVELNSLGSRDLESHVANLDVHAAVRMHGGDVEAPRPRDGAFVSFELIYRENSVSSRQAMRFVQERLRAVNEAAVRRRLERLKMPATEPVEIRFKEISAKRGAPFSLATFVPLVLILMTITGSVYPAIDLTAGERERGTLEMLIAAPISRMTLLVAKYAAVLIVAVLTALVNLIAMTVTLATSSLGRQVFSDGISLIMMVQILGLMILFAAFFSAIVLALTSFARSFKEAQAYLIPVMLLAISPGLLGLMPGLKLSGALAVAPLVNIVLLSRDILEGAVEPVMAVLAILSTAVYAVAAITTASRIFGNDALLYARRGSWSELFQRPRAPQTAATPAAAIVCLATLFPCFFMLANLVHVAGIPMRIQLFFNALVTIAVFGAWPLAFAFARRVSIRSGFRVHRAPWLTFISALALGLTLWPFAYELYLLGEWAGLATRDKNQFVMAERLLQTFRELSPAVLLFSLAVVPAMMEEFFFRGYLFQALRGHFRGGVTVLVTALLFGLFHVLSPSALMPERFLPSTLLGLVLGWLCYRAGSVLPGMLLHACYNGLLLLMVQHQEKLERFGWDLPGSQHIPLSWMIGLAAVAGGAASVAYLATRPIAAAPPR